MCLENAHLCVYVFVCHVVVSLWSRYGIFKVSLWSRYGLRLGSFKTGLRNNDYWTQPMEDGDAGRLAEVREGAGRVGREERCVI